MKKFKIVITLVIIASLSGGILAYVESITTPIIAENAAKVEEEIFKEFFPELDTYETEEINDEETGMNFANVVYDANGETLGYIYSATGNNPYGSITAMIAVDLENKIIGLEYSSFNQTPGFGDKVATDEYLGQFNQMPTDTVEIDGASGATYSSDLVDDLVTTMADYHMKNNAGGNV